MITSTFKLLVETPKGNINLTFVDEKLMLDSAVAIRAMGFKTKTDGHGYAIERSIESALETVEIYAR